MLFIFYLPLFFVSSLFFGLNEYFYLLFWLIIYNVGFCFALVVVLKFIVDIFNLSKSGFNIPPLLFTFQSYNFSTFDLSAVYFCGH